ncbi:hypothetical protein LCGC14_1162830 [marine sediment metagenome]|uniref:Uncharacterized protein n=1 Tax=marine sediment metagenome TaxID=412755 RepID=A0A0F9LX61_9ZZZZ|nr:hypothetical protein [Candidatus Scalindua sp.]
MVITPNLISDTVNINIISDVIEGIGPNWAAYDASNDRPCVTISQGLPLDKKQLKLVRIDDTRAMLFTVSEDSQTPGVDALSVFLLSRDSNGQITVGSTQLTVDGDILGFDAALASSTQIIATYTDDASGDLEARIINFSGNDVTTVGAANTLVSTYTNIFSKVAISSSGNAAILFDNAGSLDVLTATISGDTITAGSSSNIAGAGYVNANVTTIDSTNDGVLITYAASAGSPISVSSRRLSGGVYAQIDSITDPSGTNDFGPNDAVAVNIDIGGSPIDLLGVVYSDATGNEMSLARIIMNANGTIGSLTIIDFETSSQSQVAATFIEGDTIIAVYEDDTTIKSAVLEIFSLTVQSIATNQAVDVEPDSLTVVNMGANFMMRSQISDPNDDGIVCVQSTTSFAAYIFPRYVLDRDQEGIVIAGASTTGTVVGSSIDFGKNHFWINGYNAQNVNPTQWISTVKELVGTSITLSNYEAERGIADANAVTLQTTSVYFSDDVITSRQFIEIVIPGGQITATAAIPIAVDASKAFAVWNGNKLNILDGLRTALANFEIVDSTTLRATRFASTSTATTVRVMVIDPNPFFVEKTESITASMANQTTDTITLSTTFDPARTLSIWNQQTGDNSGDADEIFVEGFLQDGNTFLATRNSAVPFDPLAKWRLIQLAPGVLAQDIQRGSIILDPTETTKEISITPVSKDKSLLNDTGFINTLSTIDESSVLVILELIDSGATGMFNRIKATRIGSSGSACSNFEVADFAVDKTA